MIQGGSAQGASFMQSNVGGSGLRKGGGEVTLDGLDQMKFS